MQQCRVESPKIDDKMVIKLYSLSIQGDSQRSESYLSRIFDAVSGTGHKEIRTDCAPAASKALTNAINPSEVAQPC